MGFNPFGDGFSALIFRGGNQLACGLRFILCEH
jgi:hypothetical protein